MNKIINLFSLILLAVFGFFAVGSVYDLGFSVYEVNDIPYIKEIGYGLTILVLLLGVIRIKRRFEGKKDIKIYDKFLFSTPLSKSASNSTTVFLAIEIIFGICVVVILNKIGSWDDSALTFPMLVVVALLTLENIIYLITFRSQLSHFKLGVGPQFIAHFDREMHLYYYKGLTRVEVYQNMVNFRYKKDLNLFLSLDTMPKDQQKDFFATLEKLLANKNIFFDDSFHQHVSTLNK